MVTVFECVGYTARKSKGGILSPEKIVCACCCKPNPTIPVVEARISVVEVCVSQSLLCIVLELSHLVISFVV